MPRRPHPQQQAGVAFDDANRWRVERIRHLDQQLDQHWTSSVVAAARDGHPRAYGSILLSAARTHLTDQIHNRDLAAVPVESTAMSTIGDPVAALQDLERAVKLAAEIPNLRLTSPAEPRHEQMSIHEQHLAAMRSGFTVPAPRTARVEM